MAYHKIVFVLVHLANLLEYSVSHVALSFPPARKLDLDFLDFFHSKAPCGMPKGGFRTSFMAGSMVNVTWFMSLPHPGGYRVELLDKDEKPCMKLSDPDSKEMYINGNILAQWHVVKLPDMACEDCTIRLVRAATHVKDYGYWSCADISIVKGNDFKENCLGRGKPGQDGKCMCDKPFWGEKCQHKDECWEDADCGKDGKCVDLGGTNVPRKQCFCSHGYFGEMCKMQNMDMPTAKTLDLTKYMKFNLTTDKMGVCCKMVDGKPDEIEMVMQFMGTSFAALGWRPADIDLSCMQMPAIDEKMAMAKKTDVLDEMSPYKLEKMSTPYSPNFMLHPMTCTDVVVGAAQGMLSRVRDYYIRAMNSPRLDSVYGGKEDLTGATGWESDGMTTIIFRRKLNTGDPTDHELKGKLHVIWAKGQQVAEDPNANGFYTHDELKYHGMNKDQRGVASVTF